MSRLLLISLLGLFLPLAVNADDAQFQEGRHYVRFSEPLPVASEKIEVLEFFSYGCPHCFTFEPYVQEWKKDLPANVEFQQIPSVMSQSTEVYAKMFYAAEEMGILDKVHAALFNSVQVTRKQISTDEQIAAMAKSFGVDGNKFLEVMRSFDVDSRVRKGMQTMRAYRISGVPAVTVNGRYLTGGGMVGNFSELVKVLDYLVAKETNAKSVAKNKD